MQSYNQSYYNEIWSAVLEQIMGEMPTMAFNLWFPETSLILLTPNDAVISIPSDLKKDILEKKFSVMIKNAIVSILGFELNINIVSSEHNKSPDLSAFSLNTSPDKNEENNVSDNSSFQTAKDENSAFTSDSKQDRNDLPNVEGNFENRSGSAESNNASNSQNNQLKLYANIRNPEYQFENFIVGNSNKMAHAASVAVANNPCVFDKFDKNDKGNYNPLFIYGNSGLGKTHLLYAIMNRISQLFPQLVIIYVKGEEFTNELVDSLSKKTTQQFRDKYRKADVLLIDDIQFIAGKESIQEEFFHTFNALYEDKKQIILAADRPPRDMKRLEDRLKSRFEWGLMADINLPDYELRMAIIKNKASEKKINIPNDVVAMLAEKLHSNIRQLEGVVRKIAAQYFLTGTPITKELASNCIADILQDGSVSEITTEKIIDKISKKYNIPVEEITSRKRANEIANARHICIYLMSTLKSMTTTQIGKYFDRNHTTVMASLEVVKSKMEKNPLFRIEMEEIIKDIKES